MFCVEVFYMKASSKNVRITILIFILLITLGCGGENPVGEIETQVVETNHMDEEDEEVDEVDLGIDVSQFRVVMLIGLSAWAYSEDEYSPIVYGRGPLFFSALADEFPRQHSTICYSIIQLNLDLELVQQS